MSKRKQPVSDEFLGLNPLKTFFMALSISNSDGSLSIQDASEPVEAVGPEPDMPTEVCKGLADEYGFECILYECIPVRRIIRGKVKVTHLQKPRS